MIYWYVIQQYGGEKLVARHRRGGRGGSMLRFRAANTILISTGLRRMYTRLLRRLASAHEQISADQERQSAERRSLVAAWW